MEFYWLIISNQNQFEQGKTKAFKPFAHDVYIYIFQYIGFTFLPIVLPNWTSVLQVAGNGKVYISSQKSEVNPHFYWLNQGAL